MIFELLLIVKYFHSNDFLIRDLKPKNLMITEKNDIIMIDFDRLISESAQEHSHDIHNKFDAPEVKSQELYSKKSDIYSLGNVIKLISKGINRENEKSEIDNIIKECTNEEADQRPSIETIIARFSIIFKKNYKNFISYLSNQNDPEAQYNLGVIYYTGEYIERDINKAIFYYSLASNQNYAKAQFK